MGWDDIPLDVLHSYRQAYRLPVPSATSSFRGTVLSTGCGRRTPSRRGFGGGGGAERSGGSGVRALSLSSRPSRISRDALATAVRKNFNAQPIQENEVIVNFLYSVKNQSASPSLPPTPSSFSLCLYVAEGDWLANGWCRGQTRSSG